MTAGSPVFSKTYPQEKVAFDAPQALRYAGLPADARDGVFDACLAAALPVCTYRVCYREFPFAKTPDGLDLGFAVVPSRDLEKALSGCTRLVLFAATVGLGIDRLIARCGKLSPAKALYFQAIGAERAESLCDAFCRDLAAAYREKGFIARPRYSPGYGDLPLATQKDVFAVLDCPRRIGLTLNDSLLMSPSKSVTAVVGLKPIL